MAFYIFIYECILEKYFSLPSGFKKTIWIHVEILIFAHSLYIYHHHRWLSTYLWCTIFMREAVKITHLSPPAPPQKQQKLEQEQYSCTDSIK